MVYFVRFWVLLELSIFTEGVYIYRGRNDVFTFSDYGCVDSANSSVYMPSNRCRCYHGTFFYDKVNNVNCYNDTAINKLSGSSTYYTCNVQNSLSFTIFILFLFLTFIIIYFILSSFLRSKFHKDFWSFDSKFLTQVNLKKKNLYISSSLYIGITYKNEIFHHNL